MYYIEKRGFWSQILCFVLKNEDFKKLFREKILFLCIILKNYVFDVNSFVLYWIMRNEDFLKLFPKKKLHSYVLYWKMRFLKSILLFCIERWGMGISKNSFRKFFAFLCIILKNEVFEANSFVLYWKMMIYKNLFWKTFHPLCIILKNDVFEVNSFVLYWKMRNEDFLKLFPKKFCILMYYIEKWCFRSQFFCFILKNEEWGFLKTPKNFCFLCIILKNEVFKVNSFVFLLKNENF